jgi:hypothetical protein
MDIEIERQAFESALISKRIFDKADIEKWVVFNTDQNKYKPSTICTDDEMFATEWMNVGWRMWCEAKKQDIPIGFVLVPKLSANYLFNQVPELGYEHQDEKDTVLYHLNYMASEFKESAKDFVKKDHEKQIKFLEEEAREQNHEI